MLCVCVNVCRSYLSIQGLTGCGGGVGIGAYGRAGVDVISINSITDPTAD